MIKETVAEALKTVVKELYKLEVESNITYPEAEFGDLSTNIAFQLAKQLKKPPQSLAVEIASAVKHPDIEKAEALSGFINFRLANSVLIDELNTFLAKGAKPAQVLAQKTVVTEYSDPNPFKELHAGHLYTSIVGDAISNLLAEVGAAVHRVNFGGDVGLHVAKALWGILQLTGGEDPNKLKTIKPAERASWLAKAYVKGAKAYEDDPDAKLDIRALNERVYKLVAEADKASPLATIYWQCRQWSYDYFESFYKRIGSGFEKYYPESLTAPIGLVAVKKQLKAGVFANSDGAVIFKGDDHNLHNRVFITSSGLPTYETKDIGLALAKWQDYKFDLSLVITGNDITEYMKVVLKALEQFESKLAERTVHITHGIVKLKDHGKMSSRLGNVLRAVDVIDDATKANQKQNNSADEAITLGAIKYSFLKQGIGGDIIFDPAESVNLQGNSGPYLQYSFARAQSILRKAKITPDKLTDKLSEEARPVVVELLKFKEVVEAAALNYAPHDLATYLYELAQSFNLFYQNNKIIGADNQEVGLALTAGFSLALGKGLSLLGIKALERM